jgi:DNA-directed RNA polymerase subunit beta
MNQYIFFEEWTKNFYNKPLKNNQFEIKASLLSQENVESCLPSMDNVPKMVNSDTSIYSFRSTTENIFPQVKPKYEPSLVVKHEPISESTEKGVSFSQDSNPKLHTLSPILLVNNSEETSDDKLTGKANLVSLKNVLNIPNKIVDNFQQELNPNLTIMQYNLQSYHRSNQDTCMLHRPSVSEGQWVQKGDLLADCSASIGGELALGQNIFVAYMPWEGYNYEDAILISQRLVYDDIYTSIHIERYEIETRETKFGVEEITRQIPEIDKSEVSYLDKRGIIKIGTWVEEGTILVGKVTPTNKKYHSPYQKLLYTILEKEFLPTRDTSLRAPKGLKAKVIDIQVISTDLQSIFSPNLENRLQVQSNLIKKHNKKDKITQKQYKKQSSSYRKWFMFSSLDQNFLDTKKKLKSQVFRTLDKNLKKNISSLVDSSDKRNTPPQEKIKYDPSVVGKHESINEKRNTKTNFTLNVVSQDQSPFPLTLHKSYTYPVIQKNHLNSTFKLASTAYLSTSVRSKSKIKSDPNSKKLPSIAVTKKSIQAVHIYLAEKRKIQMGDKMAGRHGNKGIVSQVLPRQDMPYLPDGTPIDMVLNPLGVPSRMNVGQIYECLLGLAGKYLGEYFRIAPFDEIYGAEASRSLVYSKLYEVRKKTGSKWIFNPNNPGKMYLYDGRTGESFDQAITVGQAYMLKLVHLVDDKIHARSTGPYSLVTQQPLRGRSKQGGQRLGEMEVWALEGYGAAFTLLEMLTIKSDDMTGRITLWSNIILNKEIYIGTPESFKVLVCELQALCLDIGLFRFDSKGFLKQVEHLMKLP